MVEAVWGRLRHSRRGERREPSATSPIFVVIAGLRWAVAIALLALIGWGLANEARTSYLQSQIFSHFARETSFSVEPGPSETIVFPKWGPYDERLGYTVLPSFVASLSAHGFAVERQAEWSPPLTRFVDQGGYALYGEKARAGLKLFDREQNLLYQTSHPERAYSDFASLHDPHLLGRAASAVVEILVEADELNLVPADADAEPEASAAQHVERGGLFCDQHRLALCQNQDTNGKADPLRRAR